MANSAPTIKNVAFIGLNHSGKTSLVEAILHLTGAISRRGKVQDGTTTMDYEPEAVQRLMSTSTSFGRTTYNTVTLNIADCPGFIDFQEEVKLALCGFDLAVFVVEPDSHKLIQMDNLLRYTQEIGLPSLIFINKMDKNDVDFADTLNSLKNLPGAHYAKLIKALQLPINGSHGLSGYINIVNQQAYAFDSKGKAEITSLPDSMQQELSQSREELIDRLADGDDTVLEMVLNDQEPSADLLSKDLQTAVAKGAVIPVLIGSAHTDAGVYPLLDAVLQFCPSPLERQYKDVEGKPIAVQPDGPIIAQVLKTYVNPQSGKFSVVRIFSGTVNADSALIDINKQGPKERIGGLYWLEGKKHENLTTAGPGAIIALARLETPRTGDTISTEKATASMPMPAVPPPLYSLAISPKNRNDESKLSGLLAKICEEDQILFTDRDPDTNEFCLYGQGEVHLTVNQARLSRKYNIQLDSKRPSIAYKETISDRVDAHGRHKKQTGGRGQFGDVYVKIEPLDRGAGNKFAESVVGGSVPRNFIPGVEKGIHEALTHGPLAGFPVIDIMVNLFDGSYHEVDSDEMSFRMAGILAMKEGLSKAHPLILEPVMAVKVIVPSSYTSSVLGQLNGRRAHISGYGASLSRPGWDEIEADIPKGELWDYIIELRTLTQGLGYYICGEAHMAPLPPDLARHLQAAHPSGAEPRAH